VIASRSRCPCWPTSRAAMLLACRTKDHTLAYRRLRAVLRIYSKMGRLCRSWVRYGRRPRCKGKESDFFAKRSGAVMYPAFERGRLTAGPDVIR
jgi:hypothetical protein